MAIVTFSTEVQRTGELGMCLLRCQSSERGKRDVYYDKQVEKAVTVLNCMLKGSWKKEEVGVSERN